MSSRVGGAVALAAAALLAVSMLTSWWSGHPTVGGHEQEAKTVFTTLLGATGCNTGGDGKCQDLTELLSGGFKLTSFIEFMVIGVSALIAIALGVTSLLAGAIRKPLAKLVRIAMGIAVIGAIALRVQGPEFKGADVSVYFGLGLMMFAGAIVGLGVASWLAVRVPRPRVERPRPQPAAAQQPGFDVAQLFLEDQLRPSSRGPEPALRPSSPGGALPGPAGPLTPGGQPLFASAPQLRPLYEADGYVPQPAPAMPARPPTPIPRANIGAILGIPTPPVMDAERARPPTPPPPPLAATAAAPIIAAPPPIVTAPPPIITAPPAPPIDATRARPATLPPPTRSRTHSVPPPRPTAIGVAGGPAPEPNFDEPARPMPPVVPPVVTPAIPAPKGSSIGPKVAPRKALTISAAVVPPPPAIVPPVIPSLFPARPETDADPSAAAVGDATDAGIQGFAGEDGTSPSVPGDVAGDGSDEAETLAREKMSARDLGLATNDSTVPLPREEPMTVPGRAAVDDMHEAVTVPARLRPAAVDVHEAVTVPARWRPTGDADEAATVPARPEPAAAPVPEPEPEPEPPLEPAPPMIPDPPKVVPTLTSIARALRGHARAERERERTATNIGAAPERPGDEPTSPPIAPPIAAPRPSSPVPAQRASAEMPAQRASAQVPAQRASAQVPAQRASAQVPAQRTSARMHAARVSAQVPAHIPPQRVSAPVAAQRPSAPVAAQPEERPRTSTQVPITTAPDDLPPPSEKQAATSGPSPACPQCESPMAWVEEHLRFYCKSCRMYF